MSNSREQILAVLRGQSISRLPVFSGLPCVTVAGMNAAGIRYAEAHRDAARMASAAASTYALCGWESAVVPFDLCVEAEALGCGIDFQTDVEIVMPPVVASPLAHLPEQLPDPVSRAGRIPLVGDALRRLKAGVGREIAIGAWIPGPFTLAWQSFGADAWMSQLGEREQALELLDRLGEFLARVAVFYRESGADFITVHEMGGSPQAIGPANFRRLVQPPLTRLFATLPSPHVLSICGDTNAVVAEMAATSANALNVDHHNDLAHTRGLLPGTVLFGNLDPVATLSYGTPAQVTRGVQQAAAEGVNALWPGCDLYPEIPGENLEALMSSAQAVIYPT